MEREKWANNTLEAYIEPPASISEHEVSANVL